VNTVTTSFDTFMAQITKMSQREVGLLALLIAF